MDSTLYCQDTLGTTEHYFIANRKILLPVDYNRVEKYRNPLVAEGESVSSMTKIFLSC